MLSEHQCEGGSKAICSPAARTLQQLRGFHTDRRLHVQSACQVAEGDIAAAMAAQIASLNYLLASTSGSRITMASHIRIPASSTTSSTRSQHRARYLRPTPIAPVRRRSLPAQPHYVNVVIAGKHALPQWLTMDAAIVHCTEGVGIWQWASNDQGGEPDVVMACCGDTPTLEVLAAVSILRKACLR